MTDWTQLGTSPAPGRPDAIQQLAAVWEGVSHTAEGALGALRTAGSGMASAGWTGAAADQVAARLSSILPHMDQYADSYRMSAMALRTFAEELRGLQGWARSVAEQANEAARHLDEARRSLASARAAVSQASAQVSSARGEVKAWTARVTLATSPADRATAQDRLTHAKQSLQSASRRLSDAKAQQASADGRRAHWEEDLAGARRQAEAIRTRWHDAVSACVAALRRASEQGIRPPNRVVSWLRAAWEIERAGLGSHEFETFLKILEHTSTVCSVLSFIPVVGVIFKTVGIGVGIVALVGRIARMANGNEPWDLAAVGLGAAGAVIGTTSLRNTVAVGGGILRWTDGALDRTRLVPAGGSGFVSETKTLLKFDDGRRSTDWLRRMGGTGLDQKLLDASRARWALAFPGLGVKGSYQLYYPLHWGVTGLKAYDEGQEIRSAVRRRDWAGASKASVDLATEVGELR